MLPDLTAYLDQVDDDPLKACASMARFSISKVCLRRAWTANITTISDVGCQSIMQALRRNNLSVVEICSDVGAVPPDELTGQLDALKRALLVAGYFKAGFVRVHAGFGNLSGDAITKIVAWFETVANTCQASSITPLLELTPDSALLDYAELQGLITDVGTWKVQYDPANLILRRKQDTLPHLDNLIKYVATVDLHDFQVGVSFRPVGTGDCQWPIIVKRLTNWPGSYLIESGLGHRYGTAQTRVDTFALAYQAVTSLFNQQ